MSDERKRGVAAWPKSPRLSWTLQLLGWKSDQTIERYLTSGRSAKPPKIKGSSESNEQSALSHERKRPSQAGCVRSQRLRLSFRARGGLLAWRIRSMSPLTVSPRASQRWTERHRGLRRCPQEADVKTCPDCNGDGVIEKGTDNEQQCPTCGGSGFVPDDDNDEEVIRTASGMPTCLAACGQRTTVRLP